jgi:hypothetical protein
MRRPSACGPLRLFVSVRNSLAPPPVLARRRAGRGRSAEACPSLRYGSPVLLGFWPHGITLFTHCVRCARTDAVSQMTKRAGTRAGPKPAVLGGAYAQRPRPARRLADRGCLSSSWRRTVAASGPRAVWRPSDFWYSSMSEGATPFLGQARTAQKADFEFRQRADSARRREGGLHFRRIRRGRTPPSAAPNRPRPGDWSTTRCRRAPSVR